MVLRILMELHKNFKQRKPEGGGPPPEGSPQMEQHVVPYLDFVRKVILLNMLLLYGLSVAWTSSARQLVISACCARWRHGLLRPGPTADILSSAESSTEQRNTSQMRCLNITLSAAGVRGAAGDLQRAVCRRPGKAGGGGRAACLHACAQVLQDRHRVPHRRCAFMDIAFRSFSVEGEFRNENRV